MSADINKTATIHVTIIMYMDTSEEIPKLIEVFNKDLSLIQSSWLKGKEFITKPIEEGLYIIRLSLSSGIQKNATVSLKEGEQKNISIDIAQYSPHESHEWAYLNKNFSISSSRRSNLKNIDYSDSTNAKPIDGKLWEWAGLWTSKPIPYLTGMHSLNLDGNTYRLTTGPVLSILEVSGPGMPTMFVNLPPQSNLNCLIKFSEAADKELYPLDVTISTTNTAAETLLALITSGDVGNAESFAKSEIAEDLLSEKMFDPIGATIGAYYLLKIGDLPRLHNWANNLANMFPWLSDGCVIHASQMVADKSKTTDQVGKIRERLLEAVRRGLPVYSEGLRLLHEGLTQMWYYSSQADREIGDALEKISKYVEVSDCSQETTTYTGTAPDQPERRHRTFTEMSSRFA